MTRSVARSLCDSWASLLIMTMMTSSIQPLALHDEMKFTSTKPLWSRDCLSSRNSMTNRLLLSSVKYSTSKTRERSVGQDHCSVSALVIWQKGAIFVAEMSVGLLSGPRGGLTGGIYPGNTSTKTVLYTQCGRIPRDISPDSSPPRQLPSPPRIFSPALKGKTGTNPYSSSEPIYMYQFYTR